MPAKPSVLALQSGHVLAPNLARYIGVGPAESGATSLLDYSANSLGMILRQAEAQVNGTQAAAMWGSDSEGAFVQFNGTNQDARGADTGFPTTNAARTIALRVALASGNPNGFLYGYGTNGNGILGIGVDNTAPYANSPYLGTNNAAQLTRTALANASPRTLVVTIASGGGVTFYLDSATPIQQYDASNDGTLSAGTPLSGISTALSGYHYLAQIGGTGGGNTDGTQGMWLAPKIYGLAVWNAALGSTQLSSLFSDFYGVVRPAVSLAPSPSAFTCGAVNVPITLTGSGTAWGSSVTGTADKGTLSSQSIAGQVISALYTPGTTPGTVTFGDSSADGATGTGTIAPAPPTLSTPVSASTQLSVPFAVGAGGTSVSLYRGTSASGESGTPVATGLTSSPYVDSGLTNGTAYYYKAKSVNGSNVSAYSAEVSGTPASAPSISPAAANMGVGLTLALSASGFTPTSWDTSNHAAATVNSSGVLTGVAPGSVTVSATDGTHTATATIAVYAVLPFRTDAQLPSGSTITLAYYDLSTGQPFAWTHLAASELIAGSGRYRVVGSMPAAVDVEVVATGGGVTGYLAWTPSDRQGYALAAAQSFDNAGQETAVPAALTAAGLDAVAVETGLNARQALALILAADCGVVTGATANGGTVAIAGAGVGTNRIGATCDAYGNRQSITLNPPA